MTTQEDHSLKFSLPHRLPPLIPFPLCLSHHLDLPLLHVDRLPKEFGPIHIDRFESRSPSPSTSRRAEESPPTPGTRRSVSVDQQLGRSISPGKLILAHGEITCTHVLSFVVEQREATMLRESVMVSIFIHTQFDVWRYDTSPGHTSFDTVFSNTC